MKHLRLAAAAGLVLLGATGAGAQTRPDDDVQALKRLECQWAAAVVRRDPAVLERLLARDFTVVYFEGTITDREDEIGVLETGAQRYVWMHVGDMRVRVYGNTALVLSRVAFKGTVDEQDLSGTYVQTHTWVRGPSGWQAVAAQTTRVLALDPSSVRVDDECGEILGSES